MTVKPASLDALNAKNAIANANKQHADNVAKVSSSWKGGISDAYRNFSRNVRNGMTTTLTKYGNLGPTMDSLEKLIKRADDENARKAAMKK